MKKASLHQADAFTDKIFGGNPAGVVTNADDLTDEEMKNIAREMNLSETAFILKPTKTDVDLKLRYFTCGKDEMQFCGHATIAALHEIARLGLYGTSNPGSYTLRTETNAGILPMTITKKDADNITISFTAPAVQMEEYHSQHAEFAERLGIPAGAINQQAPIMVDRNLNYIYLTIKSLDQLGKLTFDFQHIGNSFKDERIVVFCLMAPETFDKQNTIHARGLAPLVGVPEDPFTGSMQAALATYATMHGLVPNGTREIRTEQGHFIERPGFATITEKDGAYVITGTAAHIFSTGVAL